MNSAVVDRGYLQSYMTGPGNGTYNVAPNQGQLGVLVFMRSSSPTRLPSAKCIRSSGGVVGKLLAS